MAQKQILVAPETATFEILAEGVKHFGKCYCPFCHKPVVIAGPAEGLGLAWVFEGCEHHQGTAAGERAFDITVLFEGIETEMETNQ